MGTVRREKLRDKGGVIFGKVIFGCLGKDRTSMAGAFAVRFYFVLIFKVHFDLFDLDAAVPL